MNTHIFTFTDAATKKYFPDGKRDGDFQSKMLFGMVLEILQSQQKNENLCTDGVTVTHALHGEGNLEGYEAKWERDNNIDKLLSRSTKPWKATDGKSIQASLQRHHFVILLYNTLDRLVSSVRYAGFPVKLNISWGDGDPQEETVKATCETYLNI